MQINFLTQISRKKHSQTYDFKIEIKKRMRLDGPSLSLKSAAIFKIYVHKQGLKQCRSQGLQRMVWYFYMSVIRQPSRDK